MDEAEARVLIAGGESSTVELKVAPPRPVEIAERLCGLANARGGYFIIGVVDGTLEIVGVDDPAAAVDTLLRAARLCRPPVLFEPMEPEVVEIGGRAVVIGRVMASRSSLARRDNPPVLHQAGGVFWIRRGTYTLPLSLEEITESLHDRGMLSWERQPAPRATLADLDRQTFERFIAHRHSQNVRARSQDRFADMQSVLLGLDCVTLVEDAKGTSVLPTNAGLLFFGNEPQAFLRHTDIMCVRFRDVLGVEGYTDRKVFHGPLLALIDQTEQFMLDHMPVGGRVVGFKRVDTPEYPQEALREAIVNAVVHRDYSRTGESVRLFYYPDRVEVRSPGLLLPGLTIGQLARGEAFSKLRNPIIVNLLRDIPGYIERMGSGVRLMIHQMRRAGLPDPEFRETQEFVVTFRSEPVAPPVFVSTPPKEKQIDHPVSPLPLSPAEEAEARREKRLTQGMALVHTHGFITNSQYREAVGVSENTATRDLEALVERGALKVEGKTRSRRYTLA